jgi:hypothetical protein
MKLPSLSTLAREAALTFRRFPIVILDALAGTIAAIVLINRDYDDRGGPEERIFLAALLGIAFLFALTVFAERRGWSRSRIRMTQAAGAVLLILYGMTLPAHAFIPPSIHLIRFWLIFIAAHLCVAFAPFIARGETNGFWQFNRILFLRSLTSMLYALVLYAGLAIALAAIDNLFDVNVPSDRYLELFSVIAGLFMTWFFLSGVPDHLERLESEAHYPKALKVFTQYVLIPLVVVYLVILYAYMAKILITWDWPQGWVANLVIGFSVAGIFSLLLVYPIQSLAENVWIRSFARWFHVALIPLVGLLLLAVWRRVGEYGMTENRYFVIVLGLWLAAMVVMSFATGGKHIKAIPLSLCLVALLSAWGPWGAFAVSEKSQRGRLTEILERNGMLEDGRVRAPARELEFADIKEVSSIVAYMLRVHDVGALQPVFREDLREVVADSAGAWRGEWFRQAAPKVVHLMGIPYVEEWRVATGRAYSFGAARRGALDVRGFDLLFTSVAIAGQDMRIVVSPDSVEYVFALADSGSTLQISRAGAVPLRMPFRPMLDTLIHRYARTTMMFMVDPEVMCLRGEEGGFSAVVYPHAIQIERRGETLRVTSLEADALLK